MNFIATMLLYIVVGSVILMAGTLVFRDPDKTMRSAIRESLIWGLSFFVMLSAQVVAIAAMH